MGSVKEGIQVFHQSLRYLVNHSEEPSDSFVKFSEKSLKQLRSRQNQQIDKIYLQFKNPVPSKFQSVMNEYLKKVCAKGESQDEDGLTARVDIPAKINSLLQDE